VLIRQRIGYAVSALVCILWVLANIPEPSSFIADNDWGLQLAGANQILHGEHPYVDFPIYYGPLTPYASALALRLTNMKPIGEIILAVVGYSLAYLLLFHLVYRATDRMSLAISVTLIGLLLIPRMYKYYIVLGPMATLTALWWYVDKPNKWSWLISCIVIVLTGLFRQDYGVYAVVVGALVIVWRYNGDARGKLRELLKYIVTLFLIASPWLLFLQLNGSLYTYFYTSIIVAPHAVLSIAKPLEAYDFRASVFTKTNVTFIYFWFFNMLPTIGLATLWFNRQNYIKEEHIRVLSLIVLSELAMVQSMHRTDYSHVLQAIPMALVLYGWLAENIWQKLREGNKSIRVLAVMGGVGWLFIAGLTFPELIQSRIHLLTFAKHIRNLSVYTEDRPDYVLAVEAGNPTETTQVIRYIMKCSTDTDRIIAYVRSTNLYYMTNRRFGGGIMSVNPGLLSSDEEKFVIETLENQQPIIFVDRPEFTYTGNVETQFGNYATDLHDYLYAHFTEVERFGALSVLVNRSRLSDLPSPSCLPANSADIDLNGG